MQFNFSITAADTYVHGYSEKEIERLNEQGAQVRNVVYNDEVASILSRSNNVTELGSGSGVNISYQLSNFSNIEQYIAIDIAQSIYEKQFESLINKLIILEGDVHNYNTLKLLTGKKYEIPKSSQDVVFGTWVLEHLHSPVLALKEAYKILKDGGYLIFTECSWEFATIELSLDKKNVAPKLKHLFERYSSIREKFINKQISVGVNPFYGHSSLIGDLGKIYQPGDSLVLRLLDISPGAKDSIWKKDKLGQVAAADFIFSIFINALEDSEKQEAIEVFKLLKKEIETNPENFKIINIVYQGLLKKGNNTNSIE